MRHSRFALPRASYAPLGLLMLGRMALSGTAALQRALRSSARASGMMDPTLEDAFIALVEQSDREREAA